MKPFNLILSELTEWGWKVSLNIKHSLSTTSCFWKGEIWTVLYLGLLCCSSNFDYLPDLLSYFKVLITHLRGCEFLWLSLKVHIYTQIHCWLSLPHHLIDMTSKHLYSKVLLKHKTSHWHSFSVIKMSMKQLMMTSNYSSMYHKMQILEANEKLSKVHKKEELKDCFECQICCFQKQEKKLTSWINNIK